MTENQPWPDRENLTPHPETTDEFDDFFGPTASVVFIETPHDATRIVARFVASVVVLSLAALIVVATWWAILWLWGGIQSSM